MTPLHAFPQAPPGLARRAILFAALALATWSAAPAALAQTSGFRLNLSPTPLPTLTVPLDIQLTFQLGTPPESAVLYVRATGSGDGYTEITASQGADPNVFTGTVPDDLFSPAGVDFYVEYVSDGEVTTSPAIDPELNPARLPVISRRLEADVSLFPRQYELVTVPVQALSSLEVVGAINQFVQVFLPNFALRAGSAEPEDVLGDDPSFGTYSEEAWRILRWDPFGGPSESGGYRDGPAEVGALEPGKGFWLASAAGGGFDVASAFPAGYDLSSLEALESLSLAAAPVQVRLEPGWNQIGSPYLFPVAWADVQGSELVQQPVARVGGEYEGAQEVLEPWKGYFVFNPTPSTVPLLFSIPDGVPEEQENLSRRLLSRAGSGAFLLQISTDEVAGGDQRAPIRTRNTFAGIGNRPLDVHAPPPIADGLRVRLRSDDGGAFASAIEDAQAPHASWTVEIVGSDRWLSDRLFDVRLDEHGRLPPGWSYRLSDADTGEPLSITDGGRLRVRLGPGQTARRFRLTIAPDGALPTEAPAANTPLFGQLAPNPLQSGQAIALRCRTPGGGELVVLDVLGRPVHRMRLPPEPGWHEATWDGRSAGAPVAPGLYFFHLRTPAGHAARTLTVVR